MKKLITALLSHRKAGLLAAALLLTLGRVDGMERV